MFLLISGSVSAAADAILAYNFKMAGDATRMRVVMQFDREPNPRWFLLRGPYRLVMDFPETLLSIDPQDAAPRGLVRDVRYGKNGDEGSRIILGAKTPFTIENVAILENEASPGYRMVVDIVTASNAAFDQALADQVRTTGSTRATEKGDRVGEGAFSRADRFTIVIDPGHGGFDSGAKGLSGTLEKTITLAFGLELRERLEKSGKYTVFMTRDKDAFLGLDERVRFARSHDADLLISIHADSIRYHTIRGATVYTVSDKASDAESAALAARENLSDQLAGMEIDDENHEVSDILIDLIRRETHAFSLRFAQSLVGELSSTIDMIKNPHRFAGFRVLRAPDVPSVLLELGYLSNGEDEGQLRDPKWRSKAIDRITATIDGFAAARVGG